MHLWSRCSFLRDLDLFLKLRHVEEFPGCPHFIWDTFSCRTREANLDIGRRRREQHQRRSGFDSLLRWRSEKGPQLEKRLRDTQH